MMENTESGGHPALTDAQTGLPNKLHWDTVFGIVFAAGDRGIPLTLLLLELDDYQEFLRQRDPPEVDRVFGTLGWALGSFTRQTDLAARTQEGRFAFLLLDCNLAGGRLVADRLDAALEAVREMSGLSFCIGVAAFDREMKHPQDLVGAAEGALRAAQARGENQMEFHR